MQEKLIPGFSWDDLGDIEEGRRKLGTDMPVFLYRLLQYSMKDILAKEYGQDKACELLRNAGFIAGVSMAQNALDMSGDFDFFVANLANKFLELKIGVLRIEKSDLDKLSFTLTVSEDLDCSGLPVSGDTVCDYDEGLIAGILEAYTGRPFEVKEIDCWATGDRTCRFTADAI